MTEKLCFPFVKELLPTHSFYLNAKAFKLNMPGGMTYLGSRYKFKTFRIFPPAAEGQVSGYGRLWLLRNKEPYQSAPNWAMQRLFHTQDLKINVIAIERSPPGTTTDKPPHSYRLLWPQHWTVMDLHQDREHTPLGKGNAAINFFHDSTVMKH